MLEAKEKKNDEKRNKYEERERQREEEERKREELQKQLEEEQKKKGRGGICKMEGSKIRLLKLSDYIRTCSK